MTKNQLSEDTSLKQEGGNQSYKGFFSHDTSIRLGKRLMQITNGDTFFQKKMNEWIGTALNMTEAQENIQNSIDTALIKYFQLLSHQNAFIDGITEVYIDENILAGGIACRLGYPDMNHRLQLATEIIDVIKSHHSLVFYRDGFSVLLDSSRRLYFKKI